jgi:hypothetical protein
MKNADPQYQYSAYSTGTFKRSEFDNTGDSLDFTANAGI